MGKLACARSRAGEEKVEERGRRQEETRAQCPHHLPQEGQQGSHQKSPGCRGVAVTIEVLASNSSLSFFVIYFIHRHLEGERKECHWSKARPKLFFTPL